MRVAVLVPRRPDGGQRDRVWKWVRPWWEPLGHLVEGHHLDGPFNRSAAINRAAADAGEWDVAVIIDSDVVCDYRQVQRAIEHAWETGGPALAYRERIHLTREMTDRIIEEDYLGNWAEGRLKTYWQTYSSANVVRRDLWEEVQGFDELFVGWGAEDDAFKAATETLFGGTTYQVPGRIWHLWHPASPESKRTAPTYRANYARYERYRKARGNPAAMRELIGGAQ